MKFVRLTDCDERPVVVNLDLMYLVRRMANGLATVMTVAGSGHIYVRETPEEILALAGVAVVLEALP